MLKCQNFTYYGYFGKRRKPLPEGLFFKKQKIVGGQSENLPFFIWRDLAVNIRSGTAYNYSKNRTEQNRTEQNRTEQNRTEQNRTEQNRTEQNRTEQIQVR
jgi:hypothetical protein